MENKKIFSDDVVQGITSGNETQYSRISIDGLKKILGGKEMRNVTRGSSSCCMWESPTPDWNCVSNATEAIFMATPGGWWCCNCAKAFEMCPC